MGQRWEYPDYPIPGWNHKLAIGSNRCQDKQSSQCTEGSEQSRALWDYMSNKEGRQWLLSVTDTFLDEIWIHLEYGSQDGSQCIRQQEAEGYDEEEAVSWKTNTLEGMYHCQSEEVTDIKKSYQWLEKAGLMECTEALIMYGTTLSKVPNQPALVVTNETICVLLRHVSFIYSILCT